MKRYFRLIRLPNVFTAFADSWAGYFFAIGTGNTPDALALGLVVLASGCFYAAGMILNDLCDLAWDRKHRPERPLPSRAVSVRQATLLCATLLAAGLLSASLAGREPAFVASALVAAIITYNLISKRLAPLAAFGMGSCRFLNLFLGVAAVPGAWPRGWMPAAILGAYVFTVTLLSRMEDGPVEKHRLTRLLILLLFIPTLSVRVYQPQFRFVGAAVLSLALFLLSWKCAHAWREASRASVVGVIKMAILCIVILDAALVLGSGHTFYGLAALVLVVPPAFLARRFAMT